MRKNNNEYNNQPENIKPLFKYIGGKSWLKDNLRTHLLELLSKKHFTSYCEPFAGGLGSFLSVYDILLSNNIKKIILSDINETLIYTYQQIKDHPKQLLEEFLVLENKFNSSIDISWKDKKIKEEVKAALKGGELFFNSVKKDFNLNKDTVDIKQSARLIFLQKHSFNGIYRENSKGQYNTPFNWSGNNMLLTIESKIYELHTLFSNFDLKFITQSFEKTSFTPDTLFYLDPPYINEEISENKYNKDFFTSSKQLQLINLIKDVSFIYSNHNSPLLLDEFHNIFGNTISIQKVIRKNIMSAKSQTRQNDVTEILVSKI